jgi:hypothetical protein
MSRHTERHVPAEAGRRDSTGVALRTGVRPRDADLGRAVAPISGLNEHWAASWAILAWRNCSTFHSLRLRESINRAATASARSWDMAGERLLSAGPVVTMAVLPRGVPGCERCWAPEAIFDRGVVAREVERLDTVDGRSLYNLAAWASGAYEDCKTARAAFAAAVAAAVRADGPDIPLDPSLIMPSG